MKIKSESKRALRQPHQKGRVSKMVIAIVSIILCALLVLCGVMLYGKHQMSKIPALSFREVLEYSTKDNPDAVITVGIIKDGEVSYTIYGENGKELPAELHTYEVGSLTKPFTAAMISKAVQEEKIDMSATIDQYLALPKGNLYPSIEELLTHTSGYRGFYFESPMVSNFLWGKNDFYGVSKEMLMDRITELSLTNDEYKFNYSNFGYAVLGLVLEAAYENDYTSLLNEFVQNELNLRDTKISDKSGDLGKYWDWKENDAYLPAGAITSNISDMLAFAQIQLDEHDYFADCHKSLKEINAPNEQYKMMDINMDEIGMAWLIDKENNIIWHNGGTGNYNCYLGFNLKTGTAVVVLSNLSPNTKIPATLLGVKLLTEL